MRLIDLDACFLRREIKIEPIRRVKAAVYTARPSGPFTDADIEEIVGEQVYLPTVEKLAEADGVMYLCPLCFKNNGGAIGTHRVLNWFVGKVPDDVDPKPGRWNPSGTGLHDLTFVGPGAVSVLLTGGCGWHGFVSNGNAD